MKNEHATCRANDIKQKRLLEDNPAYKEKKNRFAFFFPYLLFFAFYFIFVILQYLFSFISTLRTMCVLSVGVLGECWFSNFCFLCYFFLKKIMFDLLNSRWFLRI